MDTTPQVPADWFRDPEYCARLGRQAVGTKGLDILVQGPDAQVKADQIAEAYRKYKRDHGDKVGAVKAYRAAMGGPMACSLREAVDYVNSFTAQATPNPEASHGS